MNDLIFKYVNKFYKLIITIYINYLLIIMKLLYI